MQCWISKPRAGPASTPRSLSRRHAPRQTSRSAANGELGPSHGDGTTADKTRGDISATEKKAYIAAMLCIMQKPSKLDSTKFPGAKSRYDDFVVVHMNQTMNIHGTVGCPIFKL